MTKPPAQEPSFSLWKDPWIHIQDDQGHVDQVGIEKALLNAHRYRSITERSPLNIVGTHRLLVAVLQAALAPASLQDLSLLWQAACFDPDAIASFGRRYETRFDLFHKDQPFMQSGVLPRNPQKGQRIKTVVYLAPDWPAATEITHFHHGKDEDTTFCPICCAAGLLAIPAFATSGGAGIRPSINGVPPIYMIPVGETLHQSLLTSLVAPQYQPEARDPETDLPWWRRDPIIERRSEVARVGYLHSLTFAARQVRLHPEPATQPCSRCGRESAWAVRDMVYQMGEYRPKQAPFWRDPFVAYRLPPQGRKGEPSPLRPREGRVLWRDFGNLFLDADQNTHWRPRILDQLSDLSRMRWVPSLDDLAFRCVGLRTDGKAKIYEWVDQGLDVPLSVLCNEEAALAITDGLEKAEKTASFLRYLWRQTFADDSSGHENLRDRMLAHYWTGLWPDFTDFVLQTDQDDALLQAQKDWMVRLLQTGQTMFLNAIAQTGEDAAALRQRVQAEAHLYNWIAKRRKEWLND